MSNVAEIVKEGIYVQNGGLVLINNFIPMLFERLGLLDGHKAYLPNKQQDAIHYLQYVATGLAETDEHYLALNKILCGIPLQESVKNNIVISSAEIELLEELLQAMIGHWKAIGSSSIAGLRGNWIIRDGLLIEHDDHWELIIAERAYDLLIHQLPFTFSVINYPWMGKPLYVQWQTS
ncbi:contractile injection system tape measure protein [Pedobacter sp. KACC 23697]|uniref:Contractile injection system tape measure protein n=1 Tax=Pedobacter sp. KACC 23697 TaxID=3149230 RepID=A0AAU7K9W4_9SPHI